MEYMCSKKKDNDTKLPVFVLLPVKGDQKWKLAVVRNV
jgi:hypothetical protein